MPDKLCNAVGGAAIIYTGQWAQQPSDLIRVVQHVDVHQVLTLYIAGCSIYPATGVSALYARINSGAVSASSWTHTTCLLWPGVPAAHCQTTVLSLAAATGRWWDIAVLTG